MVEVDGIQPIAHELLVHARGVRAHSIGVFGPEAGRIGRQGFVGQHHVAGFVEPELKLGVRQDDAARFGMLGGGGVKGDGEIAQLGGEFLADILGHFLHADCHVMIADGGLGGGREEDFVELGGILIALAEALAVHGALLAVFGPAGPREIAAHDALIRNDLQLAHEHRAILELGHGVEGRRVILDVCRDEMRRAEIGKLPEPEGGDAVEHFSLPGDAIVHNHIKGAQTIRHHNDHSVAEVVNVTHLPLNLLHAGDFSFHQRAALVKGHGQLLG